MPKTIYLSIIILLFLNICNAQIFISSPLSFAHSNYRIDEPLIFSSIDYEGDGKTNLLVRNAMKSYNAGALGIFRLDYTNDHFSPRSYFTPISNIFFSDYAYTISFCRQEICSQFLLIANKDFCQTIEYRDDGRFTVWDDYKMRDHLYANEGVESVNSLLFYKSAEGKANYVMMFVKRNGIFQAEQYNEDLYYSTSFRREPADPLAIYPLDESPACVYTGSFSQNPNSDDLVLEMNDHWEIWLNQLDGSFSPDKPDQIIKIPFPDGTIKTNSVLFQPMPDRPLLISCSSDNNHGIALYAIQKNPETGEFVLNPIGYPLTSIPSPEAESYLYLFKNDESTMPILLSGTPNLDVTKQNPYTIYKVNTGDSITLEPIQVFDPLPTSHRDDTSYVLNKPMVVGDFDGDGVSDIVFAVVIKWLGSNNSPLQDIGLFLGQPQTTAIPAREWLRQD
jgi:hypothetical protein